MFPIWQIDTSMDYWSDCGQLSNRMNHMICCSNINDPSIRLVSMPINNLSRKYRMRKIRWNPIWITWEIRWTRRWRGCGRWRLWNGRLRCHNGSSLVSNLSIITWSRSHIILQKIQKLLTLSLWQWNLWTSLHIRTSKRVTNMVL